MSSDLTTDKRTEYANRDAEAALEPQDGAPRPRKRAEEVADIAISVVVPTCGRPELLDRCLASLVRQNIDPSRFEIVVVDDEPSVRTQDNVRDWGDSTRQAGPAIVYIPSHGPHGPAAARNRGWRAARGAIIAFTDDDTIASVDWLEKGLRAFEQRTAGIAGNEVDAVWGRIVMPLSGPPTDYELDATNLECAEFVTANCFCTRQVLERMGGFDERFRYAWREDADLYFRLLGQGARVLHAPGAVIMHPVRPAPWGVSLSQQKKIQFDALLYKKHPSMYRKKIRSAPRWDYYLIVGSLLGCVWALLEEQLGAAAVTGAIWFAMTARFCIKRLEPTVKTPSHIAEMVVTSALIPPLAVFWRLVGAFRFRVGFI